MWCSGRGGGRRRRKRKRDGMREEKEGDEKIKKGLRKKEKNILKFNILTCNIH